MKKLAAITPCTPDPAEHAYRDYCLGCAPFWYKIPTCPTHENKLTLKGFCRDCRKYYLIPDRR